MHLLCIIIPVIFARQQNYNFPNHFFAYICIQVALANSITKPKRRCYWKRGFLKCLAIGRMHKYEEKSRTRLLWRP